MHIKSLVKLISYSGLGIIVIFVITLGSWKLLRLSSNPFDDDKLTELNYWICKSEVINEVDNFMQKKVPNNAISAIILLNECDEYGIDIRLPLCQGFLESHYSTKGVSAKTNSMCNVGAFDGYLYDRILNIHKYRHPNQSIEPYVKLIKKNYLGTSKTELDLLDNFINLSGARYASYDKYESELKIIWEEINTTTKLDSLLVVYNSLKTRL